MGWGWVGDAWDSVSGAASDAYGDIGGDSIDSFGRAVGDGVTDFSKFLYGDVLAPGTNAITRPFGFETMPGDNIDDMDPETLAAALAMVPGPWQPFAVAYQMGSGAYDMSQNGVNLQNTLRVAPGAIGAFKGFNAAGAAGTSQLGGALRGSVGLNVAGSPTTLGSAQPGAGNPYSISKEVGAQNLNPYEQFANSASSSGTAGLSAGAGANQGLSQSTSNFAPSSAPPTPAPITPGAPSLLNKFGDFAEDKIAGASRNQNINTVISGVLPEPDLTGGQGTLFPEGRTPASGYGTGGALSRFNQGAANASGGPVSQGEYNIGIGNLYNSKQNKLSDIFQTRPFRGQTPGGNTALANQVSQTNLGYDKELGVYNQEIQGENDRRGNKAYYDSVMGANDLTSENMNKYIGLVGLSDEELTSQLRTNRIGNTPEEFRKVFGNLKTI